MRRRHFQGIGGGGGSIYEFDFTGDVQEVELPAGKYFLQCWGAQGGNVTGTYPAVGSKGGYSEGIITLATPTTIYVFVGGQAADCVSGSTSSSGIIGGWNGGGCGVLSSFQPPNTSYRFYQGAGGGGTDMALVKSDMSIQYNTTIRNEASYLSRFIVAGGGGGGGSSNKGEASSGESWGGGEAGGPPYGATLTGSRFGYAVGLVTSIVGSVNGGGGGGWYGTTDLRGGGGSGFVNIPAYASYRPSGYSSIELDSGQTIAGNISFPSPSGGLETGHSGNGFARITAI